MIREELKQLFKQAYTNLQLQPLITDQELANFRVPYGEDTLAELEQLVEDATANSDQIIFAGHRGCGKSTLLGELARSMSEQFFALFLPIADAVERSDINHINVLFTVAVQLMVKAEQEKISIPQETKNQLYEWFAKRTRIETEGIKAEVGAGFDLLKLITGALKVDASVRNEITQEFKRNFSDLLKRINEIAQIIETACDKEILVIVDGLDSLDRAVVTEIFQDNLKALLQPKFRIVFTVPVWVLRDKRLQYNLQTETNSRIQQMAVVKLFPKGVNRESNAQPDAAVMDKLTVLLSKRIPSELAEPEAIRQLVLYSGGVLREVVRIARECCRLALVKVRRPDSKDIKITTELLSQAINNLKNDYSIILGNADYALLKEVYENYQPPDPYEQRFLDLLHNVCVIEYRNGNIWYDINPIVLELMQERGVI